MRPRLGLTPPLDVDTSNTLPLGIEPARNALLPLNGEPDNLLASIAFLANLVFEAGPLLYGDPFAPTPPRAGEAGEFDALRAV